MSYDSVVLADSPQAYLKLNETSGGTVADATGNGHGGTLVAGCSLNAHAGPIAGTPDTAPSFDGTTGLITIATLTGFPSGAKPAFSIEGWIYALTPSNATAGIFGYGNYAGNDSIEVRTFTNDTVITTNFFGQDLNSPTVSLLNAWHYFVVSFDGTTRTLYLDAISQASDTPASFTPALANCRIGKDDSKFWAGYLQRIAVYNTALTLAKVQAHFAAAGAGGSLQGRLPHRNAAQLRSGSTNAWI